MRRGRARKVNPVVEEELVKIETAADEAVQAEQAKKIEEQKAELQRLKEEA